jgi:tetratricopeptide (TPR) repeat protein
VDGTRLIGPAGVLISTQTRPYTASLGMHAPARSSPVPHRYPLVISVEPDYNCEIIDDRPRHFPWANTRNRLLPAFASALFGLVAALAAPARAGDADTCKKVAGDDSLAACTRLISSQALRGGDLAQAYASLGVIYIRFKGDWDRAIADYDEALRLDPKNAGAYAGRAAAYLRKGNVDRALPDLTKAFGSIRGIPASVTSSVTTTTRRAITSAR